MKFPHPCGDEFERQVQAGARSDAIVPDDYTVVRGGTAPIDVAGGPFSATAGPSIVAAACALPHGQVRVTTAGAIRAAGGTVCWIPEVSRHGTPNKQHVDVTLGGADPFSDLQPNPVPRQSRIDGAA